MNLDPFRVGLKDDLLNGWYAPTTGELYRGLFVKDGDVVLDVGCGEGGVLNYCSKYATHILFTDIDSAKVAATHKQLKSSRAASISGVVCDSNPLLIESSVADIIICMEVMEHVDHPHKFLQELFRVGKPGAKYLLSVPDPVSESLLHGIAAPHYFEKPNHIHVFERKEFLTLLTSAGFEILSQEQHGFYWTMFWLFFWNTGQELSPPWDPMLLSWAETWTRMLNTANGPQLKAKLDQHMPKTQIIVAQKPF